MTIKTDNIWLNSTLLKQKISFPELQERWGRESVVALEFLDNVADRVGVPLYEFIESRIMPSGAEAHFCRGPFKSNDYFALKKNKIYFDEVCYDLNDIVSFEEKHPELLWQLSAAFQHDKERQIEEIKLRRGNNKLTESTRILEEKDARIAELEKELATAKGKIAELEASNTALSTTARTQAATEAKQGRVLDTWQAAFKIMIPVVLQCHADGPKKRTKAELQTICSKHGGKLTTTQLEFLRDCLPDEHVNREGGATTQS